MRVTKGASETTWLAEGQRAYAEGNELKARELFEKAAAEGEVEAYYYLSVMYKDGDGVEPDQDIAAKYANVFLVAIRSAAEAGIPSAQYRLGRLLQYGDLLLANEAEAIRWYQKAAAVGHPDATFHLSRLYAYGWCGLSKNDSEASKLLERAARGGHAEAIEMLGMLRKRRTTR